jgi:hypothetical protein
VNSLTIRRQLRRHRRHLVVIAAVLLLVGMIAAHHGGALVDRHHDAGMSAAVEMCLGVFTAVGAALAVATAAVVALGRWRPPLALRSCGALIVPDVPVARARHGPAAVSVLCVCRR